MGQPDPKRIRERRARPREQRAVPAFVRQRSKEGKQELAFLASEDREITLAIQEPERAPERWPEIQRSRQLDPGLVEPVPGKFLLIAQPARIAGGGCELRQRRLGVAAEAGHERPLHAGEGEPGRRVHA